MRYFKGVVIYIHQNPVHHGFCQHPLEYGWSSYLSIISIKPSKLNRTVVLGWFDDKVNFKRLHDKKIDIDSIDKYLGL
jgi:putative transposase